MPNIFIQASKAVCIESLSERQAESKGDFEWRYSAGLSSDFRWWISGASAHLVPQNRRGQGCLAAASTSLLTLFTRLHRELSAKWTWCEYRIIPFKKRCHGFLTIVVRALNNTRKVTNTILTPGFLTLLFCYLPFLDRRKIQKRTKMLPKFEVVPSPSHT